MNQRTYQSYQARVKRLEAARRVFRRGDRRILAEANRLRECLADQTALNEGHADDEPEQT